MNRLEPVSGSDRVPSVLLAASASQTGTFSRHVYLERVCRSPCKGYLSSMSTDVGGDTHACGRARAGRTRDETEDVAHPSITIGIRYRLQAQRQYGEPQVISVGRWQRVPPPGG